MNINNSTPLFNKFTPPPEQKKGIKICLPPELVNEILVQSYLSLVSDVSINYPSQKIANTQLNTTTNSRQFFIYYSTQEYVNFFYLKNFCTKFCQFFESRNSTNEVNLSIKSEVIIVTFDLLLKFRNTMKKLAKAPLPSDKLKSCLSKYLHFQNDLLKFIDLIRLIKGKITHFNLVKIVDYLAKTPYDFITENLLNMLVDELIERDLNEDEINQLVKKETTNKNAFSFLLIFKIGFNNRYFYFASKIKPYLTSSPSVVHSLTKGLFANAISNNDHDALQELSKMMGYPLYLEKEIFDLVTDQKIFLLLNDLKNKKQIIEKNSSLY